MIVMDVIVATVIVATVIVVAVTVTAKLYAQIIQLYAYACFHS